MSLLRIGGVLGMLIVGSVWAAAPPGRAPIARWIEELASEDPDTWRQAVDGLWKAGRAAEPALRAAMKHRDPDVPLRARLVLGRFEWGIFPDTPAVVVRAIERYRDGEAAQRTAAAEELIKQGRAGYAALQRLLDRETNLPLRQQIAAALKRQYREVFRGLLAAGDRQAAFDLLEATATGGTAETVRDLAVFLVLTGQAKSKAQEYERRAMAGAAREEGGLSPPTWQNRLAALRGIYLYRALGDLAAAQRMADKAGEATLVADLLIEQDDHKTLARNIPRPFQDNPAHLAVLLYHAGDRDGCEAALRRVSAAGGLPSVLFFTGRPRQAIEAQIKAGSLASACRMLALQGRRREALELTIAPEAKDQSQRGWLLLEQAVLRRALGDEETGRKLFVQALEEAEKQARSNDALLAAIYRGGLRLNRRDEVLRDLAGILDRVKPASPRALFSALSPRDAEVFSLWWDYLRKQMPEAQPSAILTRLRGWFEHKKADNHFAALALLAQAEKLRGLPPAEEDRWIAALARTYEATGQEKKAEQWLRDAARTADRGPVHQHLGDFLFERKRWTEAAAAYATAAQRDPIAALPVYLRGIALARAGQEKEGRALIERARLMPLADEATRYNLADGLARRGLVDEADAERLLILRSAEFRSIYATNAAASLAARAVRQGQSADAARWYRRLYLNLGLSRGAFLDDTAYLRVPALVHLHRARVHLDAGNLDEALAEARRLLDYLPEETSLAGDLVRALDRARRKADADRLFNDLLARHEKACADHPRAAECHNRLAWLTARAGRHLDRAVRHAKTATELAPTASGYWDTRAEAHFQKGEKAEALAAIKQAIKLAPDRTYYAAQLKRIEQGDPRAPLPPS